MARDITKTKKFKVIKSVIELIFEEGETAFAIELFGTDDTEDFVDIFFSHLGDRIKNYRLTDIEKCSRVKSYIKRYQNEFGSKSFVEIKYCKSMDGIGMLYSLRGIDKVNFKNVLAIKEEIKDRLRNGFICFEENKRS
jgi:hypothetical protein